MVLALVMALGVLSGCGERKQPTKEAEKPAATEQKAAEKPADDVLKAPADVKRDAEKTPEDRLEEKGAEVKKEVKAAVEKAVDKVETAVASIEKSAAPASPEAKNVEAGAAIFASKCSPCHGPSGKGTPMAPAFVGNDWIKAAAPGDIASVIKNGRAGAAKRYKKFPIAMPAQKTMADSDISSVVDYLKSIN